MVFSVRRRAGFGAALAAAAVLFGIVPGSAAAQTMMPTGDPAEVWEGGSTSEDLSKSGNSSSKIVSVDSSDPAALAAAGVTQPGLVNETRVLCLHSHTPDDSYTLVQTRGFFDALKKRAPGPITMFREYLFLSLRGEDDGYHGALVDLLTRRYAGVPISMVMITDTRALRFWLDHLQATMPGVPAVFSGSFEWFPAFDDPGRMITGAMEKIHAAATVDLIRKLRPGTRQVAVMGAVSYFGRRMKAAFDEQLADRSEAGLRVTHYAPTQWEQILDPLVGGDRADALIYVAGPVGLTPGKHLYPPQWVQGQVPGGVPVFAMFDAALGPEVIGGVVCSGRKMGEIAGIAAGRILFDGVKPADIPIDRGDGSAVAMFRWEALRKWGIDEASLPAGSEIIGRPESWWARHETVLVRAAAVSATAVALSLGLVSWGLVRNRRRLSETQGRMELMATSLGEAFWIAEADGWTIRYATEAWERLWGRPRSSVSGHALETLMSFVHEEDRAALRARCERRPGETAAMDNTFRVVHPDGKVVWVNCKSRPMFDEFGRVTSYVGVQRDITEKMESRRAIEESELRYRLAVSAVTDTIYDWDIATDTVRKSGNGGRLPAASFEQNHTVGDFISALHPEDLPVVKASLDRALADGSTQWEAEYRHRLADGSWGEFHDRAVIVRDAESRPVRMVGAMSDISARRATESALRERELRYHLVARAASDIIWDWDVVNDRIEWSDAAKDLPRGSQPEIGLSISEWIDHLHPEDRERVRAGFFGAVKDPTVETWRDAYRMLQDDGTVAHYSDQGFIIRDASGRALRMVGAMKDVSKAREAEEQLAASEQRLKAAMKAAGLGTFDVDLRTGAMEHDDRTAEIFGLQPGERIRSFDARRARFHPDDLAGVGERERLALTTDQDYRCEARVRHADGGYRWILGQASVMRDADGTPVRAVGVVGDIHERRTAEEAIRKSEERFRELAGTVEQGFWVRSLKTGLYEYFSPAIARMVGLRDEEMPRTLEEVRRWVHPEDLDALRQSSQSWIAAGCKGVSEAEFRVVLRGGEVRWWRSRAYAGARSADGTVERVLGTTEDVTSRVESAMRLAESEAKFRQIAESIPQVFWVADPGPDGLMSYASAAVKSVFGIEIGHVEGTKHGWALLIHPDDRAQADRARVEWHARGCPGTYENQYRIIRADGELRHILNRGYAVRDENGRVVRITGLAEDVTERETARLKLESSERRFREMAESIDQVFWVRSVEKPEIQYVSPATKRLWGVEPEALVGSVEAWRRLIHPDDRALTRERIDRWIAGGAAGQHEAEFRIVTPAGQTRWVRSRAVAIGDGSGGTGRIVGVTEDITTQKTAELALENTLRTQRLLLSELDHRVKNNLAGLLALIEMSAAPGRTVEGFAEAMRRRVGGMVEVHAVLSSSRWEALDLSHMVSVLSPADVPGRLRVDGPRVAVPPSKATPLGMVLQELLSNSQKYGALGAAGGEVSLSWTTQRDQDALWLKLEWTELGGPPIESTPVSGLGTLLIEGFARYELRGQANLSYPREGARHTIRVDLSTDSARRGAVQSVPDVAETGLNGHAGDNGAYGVASSPAVLSTSTTGV